MAILAALACVLLQFLGGRAWGEVGAAAGFVLAGAAAFRADPRYLATVVILCLPAFGFQGGDAWEGIPGSSFGIRLDAPVDTFNVAGAEFSAPLGVLLGGFVRVVIDFGLGRASLAPLPRWTVRLFFLALIPAVVGAAHGYSLGLNRWSQGVRGMLAVGGMFWGVQVSQHPRGNSLGLSRRVVRFGVVGGLLMLLGVLRGHFVFLVIGIGAGALLYSFRAFKPFAFMVAMYVAVLGLVGLTLTTAAEAVLAFGSASIANVPLRRLRDWGTKVTVMIGVGASIGALFAVVATRTANVLSAVERFGMDGGIVQYAFFKLFEDRGPLWLAAVDQVLRPPWLIMPSGRPLFPIQRLGVDVTEWEVGSHNAFLELIRNTGWLAGGVGSALMVFAIIATGRVLARRPHRVLQAVAAAFLGISVAGVTTGNFPVQDIGFFVWALGGIAIGSCRLETSPAFASRKQ